MTTRQLWYVHTNRKINQYTIQELRDRLAHALWAWRSERRNGRKAIAKWVQAEGILDQVRYTDRIHAEDEWHALQGTPRDDESDSMLDGRVADLLQALQDRGEL